MTSNTPFPSRIYCIHMYTQCHIALYIYHVEDWRCVDEKRSSRPCSANDLDGLLHTEKVEKTKSQQKKSGDASAENLHNSLDDEQMRAKRLIDDHR